MNYKNFINNKTLKLNVGTFLKGVDKDNSKTFSEKEVKDGIKGAVSLFAKPFAGKGADAAMEKLDLNKDGKITEDEIANFLKSNYNISLDNAKKMTVDELATYLQKVEESNKKKK